MHNIANKQKYNEELLLSPKYDLKQTNKQKTTRKPLK
jgi:hypothetical protein